MKLISSIAILFLLVLPHQVKAQQYFEDELDQLYKEIITDKGLVDYQEATNQRVLIEGLVKKLESIDLPDFDGPEKVAKYINAYNLLVIAQVVRYYPVQSVKSISGFFKNKHILGGMRLSLDEIEQKILKMKNDGRIHMALVCGAIDCPPLLYETYRGKYLEEQLELQTRTAVSRKNIVFPFEESKVILLSKIFQWYTDDFEGGVISFINNYRDNPLPAYDVKYASYDWKLNDSNATLNTSSVTPSATNDEVRYYASNLYAKGEYEVNFFNNYYTQRTPSNGHELRENFFTTFIQGLWGYNDKLNLGLDVKLRSVSSGPTQLVGRFDALRLETADRSDTEFGELQRFSRFGITQVGPRVKYQPFRSISGLTFQHAIHIPVLLNGEGSSSQGYIDWGSPSVYTDIFFDHELTQKTSLFLQLGIYGENLGGAFLGVSDGYYQLATPITTIINYFPTKKSTLYFLVNSAPQFGFSSNGGSTDLIPNHYNQYGIGFKYFVTDNLQLEVLSTHFSSVVEGRKAATYNVGARYYGW